MQRIVPVLQRLTDCCFRCIFLIPKFIVALCPKAESSRLAHDGGSRPPAYTDYPGCGCPNVTETMTGKQWVSFRVKHT